MCLAINLAQAKKKVLLLEKNARIAKYSRAPAIWPRTQEILDELGVLDKILKKAVVHKKMEMLNVDGKNDTKILTIPISELEGQTEFAQLVVFPQQKTEKVLLDELKKYKNVRVMFNAEFVKYRENKTSVSVDYLEKGKKKVAKASFLVGCDGARSAVRKAIGAKLAGETYEQEAALADVRLVSKKPRGNFRLTSKNQLAVGLRMEETLWRIILPHQKKNAMSLDEQIDQSVKDLFGSAKFRFVWKSDFRLHNRISTKFQKGRVVLAGDAAHLNSPVGGQGMNAGIQDTEVLADALRTALDKDSVKALEKYARKRRKQVEKGVNAFTDRATDIVFFARGKLIKGVFHFLQALFLIGPVRRKFLRKMAMLD